MKKQFDVPYDPKTGSLLDYARADRAWVRKPDGSSDLVKPDWRLNEPFTMTLRFVGFTGSRGTNFLWENANGATFPMFPSEMAEVLERTTIDKGMVTADWIGVKRSNCYGIALVKDEI